MIIFLLKNLESGLLISCFVSFLKKYLFGFSELSKNFALLLICEPLK
jgi:hypothetical protein